jgi:hypothetical protein
MSALPASPRATLAALAERVASAGLEAIHGDLPQLLAMARRHGVAEVLIRTVADTGAPVVARERAFGRVAAALANHELAVRGRATAA